ncbi:MAG: glycosyltransferase [Candidatus Hydrogenedens sp.]|nr:glycosyltransferase [Candidatus Hydrogenedens sp.]
MSGENINISVVIPVYNEEGNLPELYERVTRVMEEMGRPYEFIFVDDGSLDRSLRMMTEFRGRDKRVRVIKLLRNFGQTAAIYAGFSQVRGQVVVMLDADLQNPPEEIPKLVAKVDEGYQAVSGWRTIRQDKIHRKVVSRILNFFIAKLTRTNMHDWGCSLKAFSRDFVDRLNTLSHHSRYLPADVGWLTPNVAEVAVDHAPRRAGETKYTPLVLIRTGFDLLVSVTAAPLQAIGVLGWLLALLGFVIAFLIAGAMLFGYDPGLFTMIMALSFFLSGVQLIAMGFLCEYVSRIYVEVQDKPYFIIKEELP